jgi:hypothetical protein
VDHAQHVPTQFPWRTTTVVAVGIALVELVALVAIGFAKLAPHHRPATAQAAKTAPTAHHSAAKPAALRVPSVPLRPRTRVRVLVLNGNGVTGAASTQAARLRADGYRIGGAANAPRHDYARSMVMFVPGWAKEARRLGRDVGVRMIAPVDGLRPAQLKGSELVLLLGN